MKEGAIWNEGAMQSSKLAVVCSNSSKNYSKMETKLTGTRSLCYPLFV